ncbi:MAG: ATPase, T2SS/T4P/T4SS family [Candidatus Methylacidiphilales bacterium]
MTARPPDPFVEMAAEAGLADADTFIKLREECAATQRSWVRAILEARLVDEEKFLPLLAEWLGVDYVPPQVWEGIPEACPARVALRHHLLPVADGSEGVKLLLYDPFDLLLWQEMGRVFPNGVTWALSTRTAILEGIRSVYGIGAEAFAEMVDGSIGEDFMDLRQEANLLDADDSEAAIVRFVNQFIREALNERATDIHVEPLEDDLQIRYRIDGVLREIPVPPQLKLLQASVISRLKIMAHLDIAERRLPQDGRFTLEFGGQTIDVRVATIPSVNGESVSLRLLGQQRFDFARLGMDPETEKKIRHLLAMPNGIILITGPTGCGKSTSLYTFLSAINTKDRRIVTIEDPVENKLPGVIQIPVKSEINLTFATALRSVLRGDPNVIMVGEMRDFETAEIAIRAALTGHLVFSTLHTNDAIGGITRLLDMGVEPFLVASSVRAFLAQRLVRTICPHCAEPAHYPISYLKQIGFPVHQANQLKRGRGCRECRQTGYAGRMAIFEVCLVSEAMQDAITRRQPATVLRQIATGEGMVPLRRDGWRKAIEGRTTLEEIVRVTTADTEVLDE